MQSQFPSPCVTYKLTTPPRRPQNEIQVTDTRSPKRSRTEQNAADTHCINWAADMEKLTLFEIRKITQMICAKERQIAEAEEYLRNGKSPACFNVNARIQVSPAFQNEANKHMESLIADFQKKCLNLLIDWKKKEIAHLKSKVSEVLDLFQVKMEVRLEELIHAQVLHPSEEYDLAGFQSRIKNDERVTRYKMFREHCTRKEKQVRLQETMAAKRINECLEDPELEQLRRRVVTLERRSQTKTPAFNSKRTPLSREQTSSRKKTANSGKDRGPPKKRRGGPRKPAKTRKRDAENRKH